MISFKDLDIKLKIAVGFSYFLLALFILSILYNIYIVFNS